MNRIIFSPSDATSAPTDRHHASAAAMNSAVVTAALGELADAIAAESKTERILLRAAAGAGKSHSLVTMVQYALGPGGATRVAVTAFQNRQVQPLAKRLAGLLGKDAVVLLASRSADVPQDVLETVNVVRKVSDIEGEPRVLLGTAHRLGAPGERWRLKDQFGWADGEAGFDVLFVDEAWQMSESLYSKVEALGRVVVGVGDVGQLPPLDPNANPWRGDQGYNPYRAWPTAFDDDPLTWARDLPAVWRPCAEQLALWRAFYSEWDELHSVAAPGDRALVLGDLAEPARSFWSQVATGRPSLIEVSGLADPEQPDVDLPLLEVVEQLLDDLLVAGFHFTEQRYSASGDPDQVLVRDLQNPGDDPLIAVLATRNQLVDDAQAMADRLIERHGLDPNVLVVSTVDKYQGQTNALTIAFHPLSAADLLDDFNSAFGRLAVVCTRATHGLVLFAREGLDSLLDEAAARPGTPFNEPGPRSLPRQTHVRIINVLDRAHVDATDLGLA